MSQVNFNDAAEMQSVGSGIGFLKLKNDGEEAVVRFLVDSDADLEVLTTHMVTVDGKYRTVNCIRNPKEPIENCPLCANGTKVDMAVYIKLIQYTTDSNGQVTAEPKIWSRSYSYVKNNILPLITAYGPLSDCIFKIHRSGAAGDLKTTYTPMYMNPAMYPENIYVKNTEAFNDYKALGNAVVDATYDDLAYFVLNHKFPGTNNTQQSNVTPSSTVATTSTPAYNPSQMGGGYQTYGNQVPPPVNNSYPQSNPTQQMPPTPNMYGTPQPTPNVGVMRPTRTY